MNEIYSSRNGVSAIRNLSFQEMLGLSSHGSRPLLGEAVFESRILPSNLN